ncbi:MAG: glycoside hydrolase family 127 protein [Bacillales bacterium]|jgi:DUF1680 family protein|nr:glycoside hydrolase family 127 protein [Bacillales bacterium]
MNNVIINDRFWSGKQKLLVSTLIPYQYSALNDEIVGVEPSHAIENFKIAAGLSKDKFYGCIFQDSDVGKWIEAASYALSIKKDKKLESKIDKIVSYMQLAQQEDGYLNTYYICHPEIKRFSNIVHGHELYCAGHLLQGAIAYYKVSKKDKMLNILKKYIDLIIKTFGNNDNQIKASPGHPEIEIALMELYELSKEKKYLDLTNFFISVRGEKPNWFESEEAFINAEKRYFDLSYNQAHKSIYEQEIADGHAVRALYLSAGAAALAKESNNTKLYEVLKNNFNNTINKRMYITSAFGSQGYAERFTVDYDLPSDRAYAETCASIAMIFFAQKMFEIQPLHIYSEVIEKALYNTVLAGLSLDGTKFFYVNPLKVIPIVSKYRQDMSFIQVRRQAWFGCACCPPNIARILGSLNKYIYVVKDDIYINLLIASTYNFNNNQIKLKCSIPNSKSISLTILKAMREKIYLRIPKWVDKVIVKKDEHISYYQDKDYLCLYDIKDKANIVLCFSFTPKIIYSNSRVSNEVALSYGPFIYALEEVDNVSDLSSLMIDIRKKIKIKKEKELNGYVSLIAEGFIKTNNELYSYHKPQLTKTILKFIPYHLWANRDEGEMSVFVNYK